MFYTGGALSLAALEMLVHLDEAALLLAYSFVRVRFDEDLVLTVKFSDLPADWTISPAPDQLKEIGDEWIRSKESPILRVPSVIVPIEANYLINPEHPDFGKIEISKPNSFEFDGRLK